ncbi:hypothetical protein [Arthrobacter mobilis]|uniref:Uncharacterized protein n=1 Tax=Arthrobacter mobilis TaxID=2724944 RepID=A0A7X6HH42_9MICC|nr:hypothetical protein [Arthrobacter mobilis]NKX55926.1 hypothetical protein [Arthrobacter mobilis]
MAFWNRKRSRGPVIKVRELYPKSDNQIYLAMSVETNKHDEHLRETIGTEAPQVVVDWAVSALCKRGYRREQIKGQRCEGFTASRIGGINTPLRYRVLAVFTVDLYSDAEMEYRDGGGPPALSGGAL